MPTPFPPEIIQLRSDIEKHIGQALLSPTDFQRLIQQIWNQQHTILSLSTIKRLWGYVDCNGLPRLSTLNTLSQFVGYANWNEYIVALEQRGGNESAIFQGEGISATMPMNSQFGQPAQEAVLLKPYSISLIAARRLSRASNPAQVS